MHLRILLLPLLFLATTLFSQDLHIYYDAFTDSVYYMQNGKTVDRPVARKGSNVMMHIQNYNNFLYNVSVKTDAGKVPVAQGGSFDLTKLLSGGSMNELFIGAGTPFKSPGLPDLILPEGSGAVGDAKAEERKNLISELKTLRENLNTTYTEMRSLNIEISKIQGTVQTALEAQQIQSFVADELQQLRYNPRLEPRQIKKLSQEYMRRIFDEEDPNQLDLSQVLQKSDAGGELRNLKTEYTKKVDEFSEKVGLMQTYLMAIGDSKYNFENSGIGTLREKTEANTATASNNLETYRKNITELDSKLSNVKSLDVKTLAQLRTDYLIVMDNAFSTTYRHSATADNLNLQLEFTPIDSAKTKGVSTKLVTPIALEVYGGLRINASLGLGFGQFFDRPQSFYVRDSLIGSSDKDAFNPYLTSFVHFYRQSRGAVSLGGSFGVGIPLGGETGLDKLAFFLGPSLILGRGERVVLSTGLLGGKVDQLVNGYEVGDSFDRDSGELDTESRYQMGFYVGISFNLIGG